MRYIERDRRERENGRGRVREGQSLVESLTKINENKKWLDRQEVALEAEVWRWKVRVTVLLLQG